MIPGIFGFVGCTTDDDTRSRLLQGMARALAPQDAPRADLYCDTSIGFGRVSLRLIDPESQPLWNEDRTVGIVMEGEIYDYDNERRQLAERGHQFVLNNDAEYVLRSYEEHGEDFAVRLNGNYVAAIWDQKQNRLILATDRLGTYGLHYAVVGNGLIFASTLGALLAHPLLPRSLDPVAAAQLLTHSFVLGQRTLLRDVSLLSPASLLIWQNGTATVRPYWTLRFPPCPELRSEREWGEALLFHLRRAVKRRARGDLHSGLLLSGGIDSRLLLAVLCEQIEPQSLSTFSWGIRGCDDVRSGKQLAARCGAQHFFLELSPNWLQEKASECVRVTDGMSNVVNLHALANLDEPASHGNVIYKGFLGDVLTIPTGFRHANWADYDPAIQMEAHWQIERDFGGIAFDPSQHHVLFTEEFQDEIGDWILEGFRQHIDEAGSPSFINQRVQFNLRQRQCRSTVCGVWAVRTKAQVRLPYCDNDLVEFALTLPYGLRFQKHLMKACLVQAYPKLAQVPLSGIGLPMTTCAQDVVMRAEQLVRWHARRMGLDWIREASWRPYKNYPQWFRSTLRNWTEDILLSARTLQRGYFQPETIRQLVAQHMNGADHSMKLGALITLELWHRQFID